jgi:uncharacterized protein YciI
MVRAFDFPDALDRRMEVRPLHLERAKIAKDNGFLVLGGATFSQNGKMNGSMLLFEADSQQKVLEFLQNDPYFKSKVWEKWEIIPFKSASN